MAEEEVEEFYKWQELHWKQQKDTLTHGRTMTKANLTEIRKSIEYWQGKVTALENAAKYGGRNRAKRFVPRDL